MAIGNKSSGRTATAGLACHRIPLGLDPGEPSSMCNQAGLGSKGSNVDAFCAPARGGSAIALASPFELANSQIV